jgi:hypothetical protein
MPTYPPIEVTSLPTHQGYLAILVHTHLPNIPTYLKYLHNCFFFTLITNLPTQHLV